MQIQGHTINFADVPVDFTPCFCDECPRSGECIRHAVGLSVPPKPRIGSSVYPKSWQGGDCPYFYPIRLIREAWGFAPLFAKVFTPDAHPLRMKIVNYLGSETSYFRHNRGERTLTPEQQADILHFFTERGYELSTLRFEHYRETFDFHAG